MVILVGINTLVSVVPIDDIVIVICVVEVRASCFISSVGAAEAFLGKYVVFIFEIGAKSAIWLSLRDKPIIFGRF